MLVAHGKGRKSKVPRNRSKTRVANKQKVSLGALQKLRKLEGASLTDGIVWNVAVGFDQFLQGILMFATAVVNGVVVEHECSVVADSQFRKHADKAVCVCRTRHHDAVLALEKFAEFGKLRGNALVFAFDVFFGFFFFADNLCDSAKPCIGTLDAVRLRSVNLRNTERFFKCCCHVAAQRIAERSGSDCFGGLANFFERGGIQKVVHAQPKRSKHFGEIVRTPEGNDVNQVILFLGRVAFHNLAKHTMESDVETRRPVLGTETFAMQRNNRHANFRFHFFGNRIDVFANDSGSASHTDENRLGVKAFLCVEDSLAELFRSAENHVLFFQVRADVQRILQGLSTAAKAVMHREVKLGVFAAATDRRMVNQGTVCKVTHLALHNRIRAHGLLVQRRTQFTKFAARALARAAAMLFRTAFVVGRFLNQIARLAVPADNRTQSIFAVFD